jgi:hypothetical protein
MANKGLQSKHVLTVNGRIKVVRRWWYSSQIGSCAPLDQWLDLRQESISPGVREMACRLNNDASSFECASANLERTAQIRMSGEELRLLVIHAGKAILQAHRAGAIPTAFQAKECVVEGEEKTRIYTGTDGVMVPLITEAEKQARRRKVLAKRRCCGHKCRPLPPRTRGVDQPFKEFKVITFYDEQGKHWHEALSRSKRNDVGSLIRREAERLGFQAADERIANVDGAPWIRTQSEAQMPSLKLSGIGLDFYHLGENVHRCRRHVYGDESEEGKTWADDIMHTFKHGGYLVTWEKLVPWRAGLKGETKREAGDRLLNYVCERRDMINYPEFLGKGWQIGSGPTESRCKTSTFRLKGRGRRWNIANAESVGALTTLKDSDQWLLYWTTACPAKT